MKRTTLLLVTVIVLGWLFDFLFWKHAQGLNFTLYAILCLVGAFLVLVLNKVKPSWRSLLLLIPILFFAVMAFVRREPLSMFLAYAFTLGLMGMLAVSYRGGRWVQYSLSDFFANYVRLGVSMIARPVIFLVDRNKSAVAEKGAGAANSKKSWKSFWAVLRGILIAIPIIVIFAALLSSADLVFAQKVRAFTELFRLEKLPEYIFRLIYILVGAYLLAGVILHAAYKSLDEKLLGMEKPVVTPFLGFTEAVIVLGAVVLLFFLFGIVQFQYFFGGQTNIGVAGYTYSEYARKGFGELVATGFFSLLLFLGLSTIVKRQTTAQRWVFSGLGIAMVILVGVMLVSAFQRMLLYEAAYGFSRLRLYTHVFMIWLAALLAVVVVLDILHRERFFALASLAAAIGFSATLLLINVDGTIVRQNVQRAEAGEDLDVAYLSSLSSDAIPTLVAAFHSLNTPAGTREAVGAALACRMHRVDGGDDNWRAFSLSEFWSNQALTPIQSDISNYIADDEEWPQTVTSLEGNTFDCVPTAMD